MEALVASCSEEFQNTGNSQAQSASAMSGFQAELLAHGQQLRNLDHSINQQLQTIIARISAFESRPAGVQPVPTGGIPNPVGSPP
eukprot:9123867-Alexandrium_andersonii.AAC.1